jgi:hypothetical protein
MKPWRVARTSAGVGRENLLRFGRRLLGVGRRYGSGNYEREREGYLARHSVSSFLAFPWLGPFTVEDGLLHGLSRGQIKSSAVTNKGQAMGAPAKRWGIKRPD